jgi:DNA-binding MarR family transcriptional regulator
MQAIGAPTQATSHELAASLGAVMRYLMANTGRDFIQEVERLGLSLSQIKTLQLMADAEPSTLGALADGVGLSLPAVSRAVDGLHKRGLVRRVEDSADRRAKRVSLTAKGRRTFDGLLALREAGLRDFVEELEPDERDALAAAIEALLERPEIAALAKGGRP